MNLLSHQQNWRIELAREELQTAKMDIDAIEEAFIRGDWARVLTRSKEKLVECVSVSEGARDGAMTQTEEAAVSMYLQSVYELSKKDELETAVMLMRTLSPLPFHISMQWMKFLIAMDRKPAALELLNEQLQLCAEGIEISPSNGEWRERYAQVTEVLVLHILLPSESPEKTISYISTDRVLDDESKQRLVQAVHTLTGGSADHEVDEQPPTPSRLAASVTSIPTTQRTPTNRVHSGKETSSNERSSSSSVEPDSDLVALGGTAVAVAAVAISLYHYRDRLRDAAASVGPALSKGLADAKYALFES